MDLEGITLPDELSWLDEMDWSPVAQSTGFGVTGSLFIQEGVKLAGRDITLVGTEELGWITRTVVLLLQTSRNTPDTVLTLTLSDARTFSVRWKNTDKALDVSPVIPHNQYDSNALWKVNALRFMEVV